MLKYLEFETETGKELVACDAILNVQVATSQLAYIQLKGSNYRIEVKGNDLTSGFQEVVNEALFIAATTNWMKPISKVVFEGDYSDVTLKTLSFQCITCVEVTP